MAHVVKAVLAFSHLVSPEGYWWYRGQSYSYHLVLGKEGREDRTTKKKKRESITYAVYREDKSIYTAREFHMGTGSNAGRGQVAGRAWAGQAQAHVRWNRLCSLTASLKLKTPHTHRAFVLHPTGSNTSQNPHPTQPKNPKPHTKIHQQGPVWDLEITKKEHCSPARENPSCSQKRPCSAQKSDL